MHFKKIIKWIWMIPSVRILLHKSVLLSWHSQTDKVCYGLVEGFVTGSHQIQRPMFQPGSRSCILWYTETWNHYLQCWSIAGETEVRSPSSVELVLGDQRCTDQVVYKGKFSLERRLQSWSSNYSATGYPAMVQWAPDFSAVPKGS